ncbi:Similar to integral membrane protein TmpA [Aspergillus kawachii IFO 4308]; acc. no. GAA91403 [Pyronema omphalodes CBS 100304]|uniref:Similar to integral membrane protein TmpA [Aspergillus kawachii IFO 4308] acc. no. GAA91403 n=1 Tax=Pyronema omphalodes (strain CBS 100304) TaxID=1076935 RepID=U4LB57_PYROM|nr:Similar to integral membrane protein TmpA [Aspergillus kawachii IFO 4308]; acc. no. GAA91403 [Pyronema omphalodes CBS 100304]
MMLNAPKYELVPSFTFDEFRQLSTSSAALPLQSDNGYIPGNLGWHGLECYEICACALPRTPSLPDRCTDEDTVITGTSFPYDRNSDLEQSSEDWTEEAHRLFKQKKHGAFLRNLRYGAMTMYRRIFTLASAFSVSLCYGILVLIAGQATFACPHLRQKHHNTFEFTHRYFGWMTVFLTRLLVLTLTRDLTLISHQSLGMALISAPTFWFLLLIVVSIVSPRALTRRMPIKIQVLSRHARRIFVHDRRFAKAYPGSLVRLSTK